MFQIDVDLRSTVRLFFATALAGILSTAVSAQMSANPSEKDVQALMQAMQEMQACYQSIDQQEILGLQKQSQQVVAEVQGLCDAGKRGAAMDKAMDYARSVQKNKAIQSLRQCAEKLPESIRSMAAKMPVDIPDVDELDQAHVCDKRLSLP